MKSEFESDVNSARSLFSWVKASLSQVYVSGGRDIRGAVEGFMSGNKSTVLPVAVGVGAVALLMLMAAGSDQRQRVKLSADAPPAAVAAAELQSLDATERASIHRLKHMMSEREQAQRAQLQRLLKDSWLSDGADGGTAADAVRSVAPWLDPPTPTADGSGGAAVDDDARGYSAAAWAARQWWKYRPSMSYSWLLDKVNKYEVDTAVYTTDMRKLYVTLKEGIPREFVVDIPVDPYLYDELRSHGVGLGLLPRSRLFFLRGLAVIAPSLAILTVICALQGRMQEIMAEKTYDLVKMDRFQLILPEDANKPGSKDGEEKRSAYDDVVMSDEIWQVLEEIMTYMRDPMKYYSQQVKLPRGILLSGPPGTGKTLLARSMARQCGLPFVFASGAEFMDSSSESGLDKVFNIFFTARANAPSFLFIDEIDALAGKSVVQDPERRAVYEEFLKELDGDVEHTDVDRFSRRQAVVLLAATNRPHELHEGIMSAGRIDREVHIGLPTEEQRIAIWGVHSRNRTLDPSVDFSKLAFRTVGFSGADIRNLVNESSIMAVRKGHTAITQDDIVEALDKQLFEGLGVSMTDTEQRALCEQVPDANRRLLAVHEAGHVLLAHLFPSFDWHAFTHILPAGQEQPLTVFYPRQAMLLRGHPTVGYLRMHMVVAHGGRCAERLVFGRDRVTDAGQDDLIKISQIAREIACSPANPRLGILPITMHPIMEPPPSPDEVKLIPDTWRRPGTQVADMSVEMSEIFTREVTRQVDETEAMALEALAMNRHILDALADHLYNNFRISGLDAAEMISSMSPQRFPDLMADVDDAPINGSPVVLNPENPGRYRHLEIYQAPLHRC